MSEIKNMLIPIIVSTPNRLTIEELCKDYREIYGEDIPFEKLGFSLQFSVLETYLRSMPGSFTVDGHGKDARIGVAAGGNEKSVHIQKMIAAQKKPKKKKSYNTESKTSSPKVIAAQTKPMQKLYNAESKTTAQKKPMQRLYSTESKTSSATNDINSKSRSKKKSKSKTFSMQDIKYVTTNRCSFDDPGAASRKIAELRMNYLNHVETYTYDLSSLVFGNYHQNDYSCYQNRPNYQREDHSRKRATNSRRYEENYSRRYQLEFDQNAPWNCRSKYTLEYEYENTDYPQKRPRYWI